MSLSSTTTLRNRESPPSSIATDPGELINRPSITISACSGSDIEARKTDQLSPVKPDHPSHHYPNRISSDSTRYAASQNGAIESSAPSFQRSLGKWNSTVIACTTALSLGILAFLIFLWAGEGPGHTGVYAAKLWRLIVVNGWFIQAVTISTTVLRFTFSVQLPIVTSMVAALILERRAVPLSLSASLSTYRAVNGGLQSLAKLKKVHKVLGTPEMVILIALALATTALQFSSTMLLSDVQGHPVKSFIHATQSMLEIPNFYDTSQLPNPIESHINTLGVFGEPESSPHSTKPNATGVTGTGIRHHGMLPARDKIRALYHYEGQALLFTSQVSCIPPVMNLSVAVNKPGFGIQESNNYAMGNTLIDYNQTFQNAGLLPPSEDQPMPLQMKCYIADTFASHPGLSLCFFGSPQDTQNWARSLRPLDEDAQLIMVFRNLANMADTPVEQIGFPLKTLAPQDEWQGFEFANSQIDVSMCFLRWKVRHASASFVTKHHLDPLPLIPSHPDADFDDETLRQTLGTLGLQTDETSGERGIMLVENMVEHEWNPTAGPLTDSIKSTLGVERSNSDSSMSMPLCATKPIVQTQTVGPAVRATFCNLVEHTQRSAMLIHVLMKMVAQATHDQFTPFYTNPVPAKASEEVSRDRASRFAGLIAVAYLIAASSVCIMAILWLYLRHCKYTKIDDFWYTISQAISEDTTDIILRANMSTDEELFEGSEEADDLVRLERCSISGRVELIKVEIGCDGYPLTEWSSTMVETG